jgi:hypothetical protein
MKDSSGQNFNLAVERQFFSGLLLRAGYQGSLGRHQPMLENLNRTDGQAYNDTFSNRRPNRLYTGFNYRSDSVSSSYNALVLEAQKRMGHGLEFQTGYVWSKLLDVNSELFAGCSTIGSFTAPYYYVTNAQPKMYRGPASFDHKYSYKFNVIYELPFLKTSKGFAGRVLGGWTISSFYQLYAGHPVDVYSGRARFPGSANDADGIPENIGGDYNLDGVANDHPVFLGSSVSSAYSGANPANGIFKDNNSIGCGFSGSNTPSGLGDTATNISGNGSIADCNLTNGVTPICSASAGGVCPADGTGIITAFAASTLFGNPAYPSSGKLYERFGSLGRGVFRGPRFQQLDASLNKTFMLTERVNLKFSAQAQNLLNHPSFDCVDANVASGTFGHAQCLAQSVLGLGSPTSRVMSIGLRLAF